MGSIPFKDYDFWTITQESFVAYTYRKARHLGFTFVGAPA
ncbi:hypothetical protein SRABI118_03879 [Massilia sp. Bi118]|nr:hypothetical protein SRABI118_03879 [Massilia sp. Bi118]